MDEIYPCSDATERATIIERTRLWLERAVIGLNLCPFAKSVFVKKQVRYAVSAATTADELLAELEAELTRLAVFTRDGATWIGCQRPSAQLGELTGNALVARLAGELEARLIQIIDEAR